MNASSRGRPVEPRGGDLSEKAAPQCKNRKREEEVKEEYRREGRAALIRPPACVEKAHRRRRRIRSPRRHVVGHSTRTSIRVREFPWAHKIHRGCLPSITMYPERGTTASGLFAEVQAPCGIASICDSVPPVAAGLLRLDGRVAFSESGSGVPLASIRAQAHISSAMIQWGACSRHVRLRDASGRSVSTE